RAVCAARQWRPVCVLTGGAGHKATTKAGRDFSVLRSVPRTCGGGFSPPHGRSVRWCYEMPRSLRPRGDKVPREEKSRRRGPHGVSPRRFLRAKDREGGSATAIDHSCIFQCATAIGKLRAKTVAAKPRGSFSVRHGECGSKGEGGFEGGSS